MMDGKTGDQRSSNALYRFPEFLCSEARAFLASDGVEWMSYLATTHCLWLLTVLVLMTGPQRAASDDGPARRFLQRAPEKWKEHERAVNAVSGTLTTTMSWDDGHYRNSRLRIVLGSRETQAVLADQVEEPDRSYRRIYGSNDGYYFRLGGTGSGKLSIQDIWPRGGRSADPSEPVLIARSIVSRIRRLGNIDLLDLVASPEFTVTSAKERVQEGQMLVEIEFEYDPANPSSAEITGGIFRHGTMVLNPDMDWAVLEANISVHGASAEDFLTKRFTRQVHSEIAGKPLVFDCHEVAFDATGALVYDFRRQHEWSSWAGDDAVFTLSAFGFPEPEFATGRRSAPRLLLAAITMAILILCCLYAARRGTAASPLR